MKPGKKGLWDWSAKALLISNLFTIVLALWQRWNLGELMMAYWAQSVTIGFFNWMRIRSVKNFTTDGLKMNEDPVPGTKAGQGCIAAFFAVHYGFFHVVYLVFLLGGATKARLDSLWVLASIAGFIVTHAFSYKFNLQEDRTRQINLGTLMFFPYARIIPMHLTIVLGGTLVHEATAAMLLLFLGLKTGADLIMHFVEHSMWRGKPDTLDGTAENKE